MKKGDILGHEFMGEIVEVGPEKRAQGRAIASWCRSRIACGNCWYCKRKQLWSLCDNCNPNAAHGRSALRILGLGLFGYSHLYGGYAGGQAEYVRVPFADVGPLKIRERTRPTSRCSFLSDIFPTGYMAAENCNIKGGEVVAVWGCGPVGQFSIRSAKMLGRGRVIAIDNVPERLRLAQDAGAEVVDYSQTPDLIETLKELTGGRGPDACIDAVGMEAHGHGIDWYSDRAKQMMGISFDRPFALRQCIQSCRKGGVVSVPGVYGGFLDNFPFGAAFGKGLTFRMGQTNMHKYMPKLLEHIQKGDIDPSVIITHRLSLQDAPDGYSTFLKKEENCIKVVLDPWAQA